MHRASHEHEHEQQHTELAVADESMSLPVSNGEPVDTAAAVDGPAVEIATEHNDSVQVTILIHTEKPVIWIEY